MAKKQENNVVTRTARNRALRAIAEWVRDNEDVLDIPEDIRVLLPFVEFQRKRKGLSLPRVSAYFLFQIMMKEKKAWPAVEVYARYRMSTTDMMSRRRSALRHAPSDEACIWLIYDEAQDMLKFSMGKEPPKSYDGPRREDVFVPRKVAKRRIDTVDSEESAS